MKNELIAAIATAPGQAGIAVIRISGDGALDILKKIFKRSGDYESHKLYYGSIKNNGEVIDYGMAAFMKAPHTYTGEDTVEIFCHGGYAVSRSVLSATLDAGCRMARAGEFTKRAFLNGRLDLSQAEAVSELIAANAKLAAKTALTALSGRIKKKINDMREKLVDFIAKIEVCIDYPEDDVEEQTAGMILPDLKKIIDELDDMLATANRGRIYKEGLLVAIMGRPNVGKSSLLNAIVGENRAIVTQIPGTTRDTLEATVDIKGLEVNLIDTAGIRQGGDEIEKIGIERATDVIDKADIILFVVDNAAGITDDDMKVFDKIGDKPHVTVINKIDIGSPIDVDELQNKLGDTDVIYVSAKENNNIVELEDKIFEYVGVNELGRKETVLSNVRHVEAIRGARQYLMDTVAPLQDNMPIDLVVSDIRDAWHALGEVTGETVDEEIVERIFAKFCVGK